MQTSQNRASRTFMDYDSIGQATDGICALYERKLKEINPTLRNLSYDIDDLYKFIDGLADLSALVFGINNHKSINTARASMLPITAIVHLFITALMFLANPSAFQVSRYHSRATLSGYGFGFVHPGGPTLL
ncbi:hypothetical protein KSS87_005259 [Heliosperma pusillum]|nr:hypothetical protein KSS87_005259 [Heliosperma pusillum]